MKTVFPKRIDGTLCACPFMGYKVNNVEEFINLVKTFFNKETGYPGLFFSTKDPNITIVFSGHQYEHPEGKPFSIFMSEDTYPHRWFSLKDEDKSWFDLFEDSEVLQKKIDALSAIFATGASIEFRL